jgi:hypothetical protein
MKRPEESGQMRGRASDDAIDFSRYFMPERLTPLFHTPSYARLSEEQRRRYNQLHACYLNEQTIFFERVMAQPILESMKRVALPDVISRALPTFMAEETAHSEMFRALNRRCRPDLYAHGDFHFVRLSPWVRASLGAWVRRANRFPLFLWLLLIQEERAMFYAAEFLRTDGLEPSFVSVQRAHLADETGHVRWDEMLVEHVWSQTNPGWRQVNVRLFRWLMREYFTVPRRSGMRVVAALVDEFPVLRRRWPEIFHELLALAKVDAFHHTAYSREVTPRTFARFDRTPEFHSIGDALPCYRGSEAMAAPVAVEAGERVSAR